VHLISLVVALLLVALPSAPARARLAAPARAATASTAVGVVNINTADAKQLTTLDGVGRGLARRSSSTGRPTASSRSRGHPEGEGVGKGLWERNKDRIVVR